MPDGKDKEACYRFCVSKVLNENVEKKYLYSSISNFF